MLRAKEPGILPRPGQGTLDQPGGQRHAVRDAVAAMIQAIQHGGIAGEIVARRHAIQVARPARVRRLARQHAMDRTQVIPLGMRHGADDGKLSHPGGKLRQVFANMDAGDRRIDRLEFAANLVGAVGLHVKRIMLAKPAAQ